MKFCLTCKEKFEDSVSFCPNDGEVLEEDPTSVVGTVLDGQYQIEGILGKGGMGAVYRARHILLGDRVAIKLLPPEMRSNTEWLRRFQREGQAARRFRHPNAVTVYDLRTSSDGTIYLVMEYVEGSTLDAELKKRVRFTPAEALAALEPVMSVLNAAHAMGVVHRDLKPENIMIGRPSTGGPPAVKLLDLGIAKLREVAGAEKTGNTALTMAGQMLGTPYYMSPEQWGELPDDGNSEIDGRADIYSLGIVFYELIAGRRPFGGLTLLELRREHIAVVPKSLREIDSSVPEDFSRAIARAIAKDRSQRQSTADELENELRSSLGAAGIVPVASVFSTACAPSASAGPETGSERRPITAAERTAPTIVSEGALTADESAEALQSSAGTLPTVVAAGGRDVEPAYAGASPPTMAIPGHSVPALPQPSAPARRSSPVIAIAIGVVVLLLVLGGGGYALIKFMSPSNPAKTEVSKNVPEGDVAVGGHEVGRYWVEVDTPNKADSVLAGESVSMESGQSFKLHFSPSENGYLYIIGPGNKNAPTTFLTGKPGPDPPATNEVKSGLDFVFPDDTNGEARWITLDKAAGTDEFTIIFSVTALTTPDFLQQQAGHALSAAEQKQLSDLGEQFKANSVKAEVIKTGASPSVSVKIPQNAEGAPVIFKVKIEHK
ncbi:MAG: protein kinase [Acidobacteriota bacterium]